MSNTVSEAALINLNVFSLIVCIYIKIANILCICFLKINGKQCVLTINCNWINVSKMLYHFVLRDYTKNIFLATLSLMLLTNLLAIQQQFYTKFTPINICTQGSLEVLQEKLINLQTCKLGLGKEIRRQFLGKKIRNLKESAKICDQSDGL